MAPLERRSLRLSGRSLPPSLWYLCRLSAWYLLPLISHTSHSLTASLTHLLAACADINFSLPNTHSVHTQQTPAHRRSRHTHTHSQADNICRERGTETRGVFFLILWLISACHKLWFEHDVWVPPVVWRSPNLTGLLLYVHIIAHSQKNSDQAVCAHQNLRFVCFGHITVWIFLG